jgi:hypothetical protein
VAALPRTVRSGRPHGHQDKTIDRGRASRHRETFQFIEAISMKSTSRLRLAALLLPLGIAHRPTPLAGRPSAPC